MNSNPLTILSDDEKIEIERLIEKKLNADPNSHLCKSLDHKVQSMESHLKAYFHTRLCGHKAAHQAKEK